MSTPNLNSLDWELIHSVPLSPAIQMAMEQVLTDEVSKGHRPPTIRLWEWSHPAVVLGRFQSLANEVDVDAATKAGIGIVRRISGGGTMFIEPGNTITYSMYAPLSFVEGLDFRQSYELMDSWVIKALNGMGIQATYQPINDITSPTGKIAGAAQARRGKAFVHHVTMAYDIDAEKMLRILRIGREKVADKGIASAGKRVDPLRSQTGLERRQIIENMVSSFRNQHGLKEGRLHYSELNQARRLAAEKFASEMWTSIVP